MLMSFLAAFDAGVAPTDARCVARAPHVVAAPVADALKDGGFDVLVVDPFVSAHRVTENDNMRLMRWSQTLGRIAGAASWARHYLSPS